MRPILTILLVSLLLFCSFVPQVAAIDLTVERQVQTALKQSRALLLKIELKQQNGTQVSADITWLKELAASLKGHHQELRERFGARGDLLGKISGKAGERHKVMNESYLSFLDEYLAIIDNLPADSLTPLNIENLKSLFQQFMPERKRQIIGALPYKNLRLAARAPQMGPVITPAYQGGNTTVAEGDLASVSGAPITLEIAQLAESLNWNPVEIYAWVKNNIETEWYWGMMKGAEETLRQKSGNDADQAALLIALYRAAGYPARFVRGVIEFFPDLTAIKKQTGITDTQQLLGFFQKAGIPCQPVISGGQLANIQIEHIWVEAQIPYANYRGARLDEHGKIWLGLDTHIKTTEVNESGCYKPLHSYRSNDLGVVRNQYLQAEQDATPVEFFSSWLKQNYFGSWWGGCDDYNDFLFQRAQVSENIELLPASLQFKQVAVTGEFTAIPGSLRHQVRFVASGGNRQLFDETLELMALSNRSVAVTYEPSTIEDQEIINSYGGLSNTPAYLVNLRPVLTVDGERLAVGSSGLPVGNDFTLEVEMISPNYREGIENQLIIGNLAVLGLVAQRVVMPKAGSGGGAEYLLHERVLDYIDRWNAAEDELASLFHLTMVRPMPTLVTMGGVVDVAYLLDTPHGFDWKGLYLDADLRRVETFETAEDRYEAKPSRLFMELSSLQGSVLESKIFEDGFGVESISTAELFGLANSNENPLVVLDQSNLAAELPNLDLPENIAADIENAVYQGMTVTIPQLETVYEDWLGTGYLKEKPATGEAGWMLSGMIAGGMTVLNPDRWPNDDYDTLANPFRGDVNRNPDAVVELRVLSAVDGQQGTVGQTLDQPLQVVALDRSGRHVAGVEVIFEVKAGGGTLSQASVYTDPDGIAIVEYTLGTHISANPTMWNGSPYQQPVGENLIDARTAGGIQVAQPITVFAFPDVPDHIEVTGGGKTGPILTWADTIIAKVVDRYGNQISNEDVDFSIGDPVEKSTCNNHNVDSTKGALVKISNTCLDNKIPAYGDCLPITQSMTETTSDIGAAAQVILGGVPDADYPVTVSHAGIDSVTVTVTSLPFGNCDGDSPPQHDLVLKDINLTDGQGNIINAAPVGGTIPVTARMYALSELGEKVQRSVDCIPSGTDTCPMVIGTRQYNVDTSFTASSVTFDQLAAADSGGGVFKIQDFPVGDAPGKRTVTITGMASKTIQETTNACSSRDDCSLVTSQYDLPAISITKDIYAVDISLAAPEVVIPTNSEGYATGDTVLNYTILPAEYVAGSAMVEIVKKSQDGSSEAVRYIDSERRGDGFVTLARGFRFEPDSEYIARVVLNRGSNATEIVSKEMALRSIALDLRADLNRDKNITSEDDLQETMGMGLVVPVNIDDDDGDGIIDLLDGFNGDTSDGNEDDAMIKVDPNTGSQPVEDDDLVKVEFGSLPGDLAEGSVILELISDKPRVRIWKDNKKGIDNLLLNPAVSNRKEFVLGTPEYPTLASLPTSIFIEGIAESEAIGDVQLVSKYVAEGQEYELDRLVISVMNVEMHVDGDRDGVVSFFDPYLKEFVGESNYTFWVNDDFDKMHEEELGFHEDDEINSTRKNYEDNIIGFFDNNLWKQGSKRDLEDFAMLQMRVPAWLEEMPDVSYTLKFDKVGYDSPKINLFEGVDRSSEYLTENDAAEKQILKTKMNQEPISDSFEFEVPRELAEKGGRIAPFIFEGAAKGTGDLVLSVKVDGVVFTERRVTLELHNVENFYDKFVLSNPTDTIWQARVSETATPNETDYVSIKPSNDYLLFVHGWNMDDGEKRRWAETIFKRLWWQGYTGKIGLFDWPCLTFSFVPDVVIDAVNFADSEFIAWQSAEALAKVLTDLNGRYNLSVLAHSQGNVVMGEALKKYSGTKKLKTYIATQAAISANTYDVGNHLDEPRWFLIAKDEQPNIYGFFNTGWAPDEPYFKGVSAKVETSYNYYNLEDWALTGVKWELSNAIKPRYDFYYSDVVGEKDHYDNTGDRFFRRIPSLYSDSNDPSQPEEEVDLDFGVDVDRYSIFSYILESQVKALGTQKVLKGFTDNRDLVDWNFTPKHYSHSRQFRSNIIQEQSYWRQVISDCRLNIIRQQEVPKLGEIQ